MLHSAKNAVWTNGCTGEVSRYSCCCVCKNVHTHTRTTHIRNRGCVEQTSDSATWKQWTPTEVDSTEKGKAVRQVFREVKGTRKELVDRIFELSRKYLFHIWLHQMTKQQGRLRVATFDPKTAIVVKADFAATVELKAEAQATCEFGRHTNMYVALVLHSPTPPGPDAERGAERPVVCDTWRIFTNGKPSAMVHQRAMQDIAKHYKELIPGLTDMFVETDGCSSQFKGIQQFILCVPRSRCNCVLHTSDPQAGSTFTAWLAAGLTSRLTMLVSSSTTPSLRLAMVGVRLTTRVR